MTKQVGDILVRGGKRWTCTKAFTCRRALLIDGDQLQFEWASNGSDLVLTAYMASGIWILGAPLTISPDGLGNFVTKAYGRHMAFSVRNTDKGSIAIYRADFADGLHCQPDEGSDTDPP